MPHPSAFRRPPHPRRHWVVLQHVDAEGPGLIADAMRARRMRFMTCRPDRGQVLPAPSELLGLIVMGGPMGVYEADRHGFLRAEIELIRAALQEATPVLGVCLGAQLLAAALDTTVARGPVLEIGAGEVSLTPAGLSDGVIAPAADAAHRLPVVHWHQDTFPTPAGATLLASSPLYASQAFRFGRTAYGLQFHVEVDARLAAAWAPALPAGVTLDAGHVERVAAAGRIVIRGFFDSLASERAAAPAVK